MLRGAGSRLGEGMWEGLEAPCGCLCRSREEARGWRQTGRGPNVRVSRALDTIVQSLDFMFSKYEQENDTIWHLFEEITLFYN